MPKNKAPQADGAKEINVKHVGGRPKKITVKREKSELKVCKDDCVTVTTLLPITADINDLKDRVKKTGKVLGALKERICRDSEDIDNLYLSSEAIAKQASLAMAVATISALVAVVALIVGATR